MIKKLLILAVIGLALYASAHWYALRQQAAFVAQMKDRFAGHSLEYLEDRKYLFLRAPGEKPDGIDLGHPRRVLLWRLTSAEAADGTAKYYWLIDNGERSQQLPFFAVEPSVMLGILKKAIPDIDVDKALKRAAAFEQNRFVSCTVWASPTDERAYKGNNGEKGACGP